MNAQFHDATGASAHFPSNRLTAILCAVFLVGVWLLARPYAGIRHDGILYVGQALLHLYPDIYSRDVFFAHGSQDSYSIFAPIYAWLIAHIGLPWSALLLAILGQIAFLSSLALLASQFLCGRAFWFGLAFVAIFPGFYGAMTTSYAENFVTARTFAEPACLLAFYCLLCRRWIAGGILLALGLSIHPLMALPAIAMAWVYLSRCDSRFWWLGLGSLLLPLLAYLNIAPFHGLFVRFDPFWRDAVNQDNSAVFLASWEWKTWSVVIYDVVTLFLVRRYADRNLKAAAENILFVALAALGLSGLFSDILGSAFFTGLQIWRAHWLLHLAAVLLTPWLYHHFYPRHHGAIIIALWYLALIGAEYPGGLMALTLAAFLLWQGHSIVLSRWVRLLLFASILIAIASVTFKDLKATSYVAGKVRSSSDVLDLLLQGATRPACMTLLALVFLSITAHKRPWIAGSLAGTTLLVGLLTYDQRPAWRRFVENGLTYRHPFQQYLSPGAQVYWQGEHYGLLGTWLLLKHPSYLTASQGGGVVFNRETARHFREREEAFGLLNFQEAICAMMNSLDQPCSVDLDALRNICALSDAPHFLIIESRIPDFVEAEWKFETQELKGNTFYLYRCDRLLTIRAP